MPKLAPARTAGYSYAGACPEFASHGFREPSGRLALYTRHGSGFGAARFSWRGSPMHFVTHLPA